MPFLPSAPAPFPHSPWHQAPLLRYAVLLMCGIGCAWMLRGQVESTAWGAAGLVSGLLACVFYGLAPRLRAYWPATGFSALALWAAAALLQQANYEQAVPVWPADPRDWKAEVVSIHKQQGGKLQADLQLYATGTELDGRRVRAFMPQSDRVQLRPADCLAFYGEIQFPLRRGNPGDFDYPTYLLTHGISGTAYLDTARTRLLPTVSSGIAVRFLRFRQRLSAQYARYFDGSAFPVLAALTLGDKAALTDETRQLFSDTGTSHVLALSGLHLSILFSLLHGALLRWVRGRRLYVGAHLLATAALWLFVLLAGSPLSLLRAAWMLTLFQLGNCLQRTRNATLNNLSFAAIVLLLVSPMSLLDVGFQLSFAAVAAIHLFNEYVWRRIPLPVWDEGYEKCLFPAQVYRQRVAGGRLRGWTLLRLRWALQKYGYRLFRGVVYPFLTVSLSAQIGTAPLVLYYFHTFAPYAFLANVVVVPAAYLLLGGALLFFLFPAEGVRCTVACAMQWLADGMTHALQVISRWPGATLHLYPTATTLAVCVLLPVLLYAFLHVRQRGRKRSLLVASAILGLLGIGAETYRLRPDRLPPQIIVYHIPQATVVHFVCSARNSYLYASVSGDTLSRKMHYVQQNFFNPLQVAPPHWLQTEDYRDKHLLRLKDYWVFGSERVYVLRKSLCGRSSSDPLPLHLLVVARGSRDSLSAVQKLFRPQQVVLDATLSAHYRQRWQRECRAARIPCHDVREEGAYVHLLP